MPQLKLLKQPGYIYDLIFAFYLKFNTEYSLEQLNDGEMRGETEALYEQIVKEFAPIPDDLYVFFHVAKNGRCFLAKEYFDRYRKHFATNYGMEFLQQKLSEQPKVVKRLLQFYFHSLTNEELEECLKSNIKVFDLIKHSDYSFEEKSRLYEFFANPASYIQMLQYELLAKEVRLATYYEKNYHRIFEAYNALTVDLLVEQLSPIADYSFFKNEAQQWYLSFCLLNNACIKAVLADDGGVGIFGIDYLSSIARLQAKKTVVKLYEFGSALGEESRMQMLDLMLEKGEITCKDLERIFHFSGSTAYHHLTILLRSGVIKSRTEGKVVLYRINRKHFDETLKVLAKYATEDAVQSKEENPTTSDL
ncbi:MAG: winged helix-turn-helix transcriptional regulator [Clostridia bacterium]|nr:winged helix-turn-helix transcriptional regulator [Clostridia bacterium]